MVLDVPLEASSVSQAGSVDTLSFLVTGSTGTLAAVVDVTGTSSVISNEDDESEQRVRGGEGKDDLRKVSRVDKRTLKRECAQPFIQ